MIPERIIFVNRGITVISLCGGKFCVCTFAWGVKSVGRFPSGDLHHHTVRVWASAMVRDPCSACSYRLLYRVFRDSRCQSLNLCCLFSSISICTQLLREGSTDNSNAVILCIAESKLTFQFRLLHRHTSVTGCDWMGLPWQFDSHSACQQIPPTYYGTRRLLPSLHEPVDCFCPVSVKSYRRPCILLLRDAFCVLFTLAFLNRSLPFKSRYSHWPFYVGERPILLPLIRNTLWKRDSYSACVKIIRRCLDLLQLMTEWSVQDETAQVHIAFSQIRRALSMRKCEYWTWL